MSTEAPYVVDMTAELEARLNELAVHFERRVEERLKSALRAALEEVFAEFADGLDAA